MAELRLTGPTEDGDGLRLQDPDGAEHALPLTPYLRRLVLEAEVDQPQEPVPAAEDAGPARPDEDLALTPRIDPAPVEEPTPVRHPAALADQESVRAAATQEAEPLSPREIQQRIRAGASVEQVARESGNPFTRIRTYGYPVLAERGWIAQQAQSVEIWVGGPDLYSDVVEDGGPSTLGRLAAHRLAEIGVDASGLEWDAWRGEQGGWTVAARFDVAGLTGLPTRERPPALWSFRPTGRHLEPVNAWARVLSEAEAWDVFTPADTDETASPAPAPPASQPETEASPVDAPTPAGAGSPAADRDADLLEILRVRRGQRVGADAESDDALAHLIARETAERRSREEDDSPRRLAPVESSDGVAAAAPDADDTTDIEDTARPGSAEEPSPSPEPSPDAAQAPEAEPGRQSAPEASPEDVDGDGTTDASPADEPAAEESRPRDRAPRPAMPTVTPRPRARSAARRASVPTWDEIVFGRKGD